MKAKLLSSGLLLLFGFILVFYWGCTDKYEPAPSKFAALEESSCTHCHLNQDLLKEVATPLPPDTSGEAGEG